MILQHTCEWNFWNGEFVLERPSSETQNISVFMERWYPYRIIILGSNKHNGDDAPWRIILDFHGSHNLLQAEKAYGLR